MLYFFPSRTPLEVRRVTVPESSRAGQETGDYTHPSLVICSFTTGKAIEGTLTVFQRTVYLLCRSRIVLCLFSVAHPDGLTVAPAGFFSTCFQPMHGGKTWYTWHSYYIISMTTKFFNSPIFIYPVVNGIKTKWKYLVFRIALKYLCSYIQYILAVIS